MEKIVYVVIGSEDGILGVYGNKKGAYKEALSYVGNDVKVISYAKVCKELKDVYNYSIDVVDDCYHYGNATIHAILFNPKK